jgi:hypothetical protein
MLGSAVSFKLRARPFRWLAPIGVGASFLAFTLAACNVPDFDFPESPPPAMGVAGEAPVVVPLPHCKNGELDSTLGESDFDCGRGCSPCGVAKHCTDVADCSAQLICHDGSCIGQGCSNDAADGTETDVDCGGGGCRPCITGQACGVGTDCESGVCGDAKCQTPACDDGVENGNETSLDCGGDCTPCPVNEPCRVGGDCVSGECNDRMCGTECGDGLANCDKQNATGCEVSIRTDLNNCGSCGNVCDLPHATAECSAGECRIVSDACELGYQDCNGDPADGCEVNLKTNELNCGTCDKVCPDLNGAPSCVAGSCQIDCNEGFEDCDDTRDNGCEINLRTNSKHCDECKKECPALAGNSAYCKEGVCGQTTCPEGLGDCNGKPGDPGGACETPLEHDVDNCGACGNKCQAVNAEVACEAGKCVITGCKGNYLDCSGGYADGCEANTDTSTAHCGACNEPCAIANGSPKCDDGSCQIKSCSGTFRDCDSDPKTGCEINVATDTKRCGTCDTDCSDKYAHASSMCSASSCSPPICDAGYDDCVGGIQDGCETNTTQDAANCGGCGKACETAGAHVNSNACKNSECDPKCSSTYQTCDNDAHNGCESDSTSDASNCGACGSVCSSGSTAHVDSNFCIGSDCAPQCAGTFRDCDENGNNGCEVDTGVTRTNCGGCDKICDISDAANVSSNNCSGSSCQPVCKKPYDDCDGKPQNGCESRVDADVANCGACDRACATEHATATDCAAGVCTPSCSPGWGACATPELGCVTPLGTVTDCTKCGDACTAGSKFCEPAGCADHRDIVVVDSGADAATANNGWHGVNGWNPAGAAGAQITVKHALQTARLVNGTATNRMIVAGVTSTDSFTNPEKITVTYGGAAMVPIIEQMDQNKQSYAGIYYLLDAALPTGTGSNDVVARFGATGSWGHGGIDVVELKNATQQAPFAFAGAAGNTGCSTTPSRSAAVTFTEPGSFVYGVLGARGGRTAALTTATGLFETWNQRQALPDNLMSAAAYTIADTSRTLTWTVGNCYNSATAMVAIERLNSN